MTYKLKHLPTQLPAQPASGLVGPLNAEGRTS